MVPGIILFGASKMLPSMHVAILRIHLTGAYDTMGLCRKKKDTLSKNRENDVFDVSASSTHTYSLFCECVENTIGQLSAVSPRAQYLPSRNETRLTQASIHLTSSVSLDASAGPLGSSTKLIRTGHEAVASVRNVESITFRWTKQVTKPNV